MCVEIHRCLNPWMFKSMDVPVRVARPWHRLWMPHPWKGHGSTWDSGTFQGWDWKNFHPLQTQPWCDSIPEGSPRAGWVFHLCFPSPELCWVQRDPNPPCCPWTWVCLGRELCSSLQVLSSHFSLLFSPFFIFFIFFKLSLPALPSQKLRRVFNPGMKQAQSRRLWCFR